MPIVATTTPPTKSACGEKHTLGEAYCECRHPSACPGTLDASRLELVFNLRQGCEPEVKGHRWVGVHDRGSDDGEDLLPSWPD
jgi:hypothetical protein